MKHKYQNMLISQTITTVTRAADPDVVQEILSNLRCYVNIKTAVGESLSF